MWTDTSVTFCTFCTGYFNFTYAYLFQQDNSITMFALVIASYNLDDGIYCTESMHSWSCKGYTVCLLSVIFHHRCSYLKWMLKILNLQIINVTIHTRTYPAPRFTFFKRNILLLVSLECVFTLMADFAVVKTLCQIVFLCSSFTDLRTTQWMLAISDAAEIIHSDCWFNRQIASATDVCKRVEKQQSVPSKANLAISVQV